MPINFGLPALRDAYSQLENDASGQGITFKVTNYGGYRDQTITNELIRFRANDYRAAVKANPDTANTPIDSWRPIAPYGQSFHDWGAAFDIGITGTPDGDTDGALAYVKGQASQYGLRSAVPNDPGHFELAESLSQAQSDWQAYIAGGGTSAYGPPFPSGKMVAFGVVALFLLAIGVGSFFRR